jgi:hypothetical protein
MSVWAETGIQSSFFETTEDAIFDSPSRTKAQPGEPMSQITNIA